MVSEPALLGVLFSDGDPLDVNTSISGNAQMRSAVELELLNSGILVNLPSKFYLSTAHTNQDIDVTVERFEAALRKVAARV